MKTVALYNLGCSKNIIDGETILSYLQSCGLTAVDDAARADIIIVNTCTFIQEATEEAIAVILEMAYHKKNGLCTELIVSGCFSQRYRAQVYKDFPEVDLWVSIDSWHREFDTYFKIKGIFSYKRLLTEPGATQYVKASDGCSHGCTYCIIPSIRGPFQSRPVADIVQEAQWLSDQGTRECILVSQDTSFYGRDIATSLTHLLEQLLAKTTFRWIRMMYLHPRYIGNDLLKLVASERRLLSYFDIPLQHIVEPILQTMNRIPPGTRDIYRTIERIRTLVSDATIRTTFILGFPGETNADFQKLLHFIEWARFEKIGVFPFSPQEGTAAYDLQPRPPNRTVQKRCETLMAVQREISREIQASRIGTTTEIIIDRVSDTPGYSFQGRTQGDAPEIDGRVFCSADTISIGDFITVRITGADDYDLFAQAAQTPQDASGT